MAPNNGIPNSTINAALRITDKSAGQKRVVENESAINNFQTSGEPFNTDPSSCYFSRGDAMIVGSAQRTEQSSYQRPSQLVAGNNFLGANNQGGRDIMISDSEFQPLSGEIPSQTHRKGGLTGPCTSGFSFNNSIPNSTRNTAVHPSDKSACCGIVFENEYGTTNFQTTGEPFNTDPSSNYSASGNAMIVGFAQGNGHTSYQRPGPLVAENSFFRANSQDGRDIMISDSEMRSLSGEDPSQTNRDGSAAGHVSGGAVFQDPFYCPAAVGGSHHFLFPHNAEQVDGNRNVQRKPRLPSLFKQTKGGSSNALKRGDSNRASNTKNISKPDRLRSHIMDLIDAMCNESESIGRPHHSSLPTGSSVKCGTETKMITRSGDYSVAPKNRSFLSEDLSILQAGNVKATTEVQDSQGQGSFTVEGIATGLDRERVSTQSGFLENQEENEIHAHASRTSQRAYVPQRQQIKRTKPAERRTRVPKSVSNPKTAFAPTVRDKRKLASSVESIVGQVGLENNNGQEGTWKMVQGNREIDVFDNLPSMLDVGKPAEMLRLCRYIFSHHSNTDPSWKSILPTE